MSGRADVNICFWMHATCAGLNVDVVASMTTWISAKFECIDATADNQTLLYRCPEFRLLCMIQKIQQPPILIVIVMAGADKDHVSVEVNMIGGRTVFEQQYYRNAIPTFAAHSRAVKVTLIEDSIISRRETVKLVLPSGEVTNNRAKVFKKRARET